jgi:hypothetical protein
LGIASLLCATKFSQGKNHCSRDEALEANTIGWKIFETSGNAGMLLGYFILGLSVCHCGKIRFDKLIEPNVKLEFKQLNHHITSFRTVSRQSV